MKRIGFIGGGNMATCIINGLWASDLDIELYCYDFNHEKAELLSYNYGVTVCYNEQEVCDNSDCVIFAIKPQDVATVLSNITSVKDDLLIISIVAGITIEYVEKTLAKKVKFVRTMPNTPMMIGLGATAMARGTLVTDDELELAKSIFACCGVVEYISMDKMNEIIAINGSSPAFIYEITKYFLNYANNAGIDTNIALRLFANTLIGSAKMMLDSDKNIDELIQSVSSKGGTTIAGLDAFREKELQDVITYGLEKCTERAYELSN